MVEVYGTIGNPSAMYVVRQFGRARFELFGGLEPQVAFSDFCEPAGTMEFTAHGGFLRNALRLFIISYPGYELEAKVHEGRVFIRRNSQYQHSEQYLGDAPFRVAVQWTVDSIACGVAPGTLADASMSGHMRAVKTPITVPPTELVRELRSHNLLLNLAYKSADDLFVSVLDCLHLCQADIRRYGGERYAWGKNDVPHKPLDEPEISRLLSHFLASHGASRNFDVILEPTFGGGKLDFYVVAPIEGSGLGKVALEAKKADSSRITVYT